MSLHGFGGLSEELLDFDVVGTVGYGEKYAVLIVRDRGGKFLLVESGVSDDGHYLVVLSELDRLEGPWQLFGGCSRTWA